MTVLNQPNLWRDSFPKPKADGHKYDRGCAVVFAGDKMTGAGRLAACAAARMGAGVTILVAPPKAADIYRMSLPAHIIVEDQDDPAKHLNDERRNAIVIGPGGGPDVLKLLGPVVDSQKNCVIDADALTALAGKGGSIMRKLHARCVLTPHEGEFARLFPSVSGSPEEKASFASEQTQAVVVLKGHHTVVASPDGPLSVLDGEAPYLATAGTGDVLAGMIGGLMAQGMQPFEAANAAVYFHRLMGKSYGSGLVASDLPDMISFALKEIIG